MIEAYLSLDSKPKEEPLFSLRFSDVNSWFEFDELSEEDVRAFLKDIEEQLDLYLEVNSKLQSMVVGGERG